MRLSLDWLQTRALLDVEPPGALRYILGTTVMVLGVVSSGL